MGLITKWVTKWLMGEWQIQLDTLTMMSYSPGGTEWDSMRFHLSTQNAYSLKLVSCLFLDISIQ